MVSGTADTLETADGMVSRVLAAETVMGVSLGSGLNATAVVVLANSGDLAALELRTGGASSARAAALASARIFKLAAT